MKMNHLRKENLSLTGPVDPVRLRELKLLRKNPKLQQSYCPPLPPQIPKITESISMIQKFPLQVLFPMHPRKKLIYLKIYANLKIHGRFCS